MDSSSQGGSTFSHDEHEARTMISGRERQNGSVKEILNLHETSDGFAEIDLSYQDANWSEGTTIPTPVVSRSFVTIPARVMSELAVKWLEEHPDEARKLQAV